MHRRRARGKGIPCKFGIGKAGRPTKDPIDVKENKKKLWKKHAKIKRGAKYNNEPQPLVKPPEPYNEFNYDRCIGQAKNHLINKK